MARHNLYPPYIPEKFHGYMDFFERNDLQEPLILEDGTSVEFPSGWTDEDADKWRKGMQLQRPSDYTASSYDLLGLFKTS
jgi:hypothetical protein